MKSTDTFKKTIKEHLDSIAANDPAFADKMQNPEKNIDDCITYILNTVKNSGAVGFADEEIFGMAMHYYDEEKVEIGKPIQAKVVVNHAVDLSEEEIAQAKEKAMQLAIAEAKEKITKKAKAKKEDQPAVTQGELF
jgi:hypothetical protein